jgi:HK97 family phage major capsid protein
MSLILVPEPKPTGNATLDSVLKDRRELDLEFAKRIEELQSRGDNTETSKAIAQLTSKYDQAAEDLRKLANRIATIDADVPLDGTEKRKFSVARAVQACAADFYGRRRGLDRKRAWDSVGAGLEREICETAAKKAAEQVRAIGEFFGNEAVAEAVRDLGTISDEAGGALIPTGPTQEILEFLRPFLVLQKLGARFLNGLSGNRIPLNVGIASSVTTYWLGENGSPTASALTFATQYLTPKRLAAFVPIANNLLRWSPMAVQSMVQAELFRALAQAIETAALFGAGTQHTPKGLTEWAGVQSMDIGADANNGARYKRQHIVQARRLLKQANIEIDESWGTLMGPLVEELLITQGVVMYSGASASDGMPYSQPYLSEEALRMNLGRYEVSTLVPETNTKGSHTTPDYATVISGCWRHLTIGQWGGIRLKASDVAGGPAGSAFLQDQTWIQTDVEVDSMPTRENAFTLTEDADTTP